MAQPTNQDKTSNSEILLGLIAHQIALLRLGAGVTKKIMKLLDETEDDLRQQIERRLARISGSPVALTRLQTLDKVIKEMRAVGFGKLQVELTKNMKQLTKAEAAIVSSIVEDKLPVIVDMVMPETRKLNALVTENPFEGKVLRQWIKKLQKDDVERLQGQLRIGIVQGETAAQITRRLFGSQSQNGADGATQLTRNNIEAVSRTATNFFANAARRELFRANADIINEELFVATLDSRTTATCRAKDGKRYPLGEGPQPPLHFRCRSLRVAIVDGLVVGERPMKPVTERMLLREFAEENGLGKVGSRDALPRGYKGDFDAFAAKRTRQMVGRVPATTSYQEFLRAQKVEFQNDVLGVTKAKLFRKGGLELDRFIDRSGTELNLSQLAQKYAAAFRKAGLDPKDFT